MRRDLVRVVRRRSRVKVGGVVVVDGELGIMVVMVVVVVGMLLFVVVDGCVHGMGWFGLEL